MSKPKSITPLKQENTKLREDLMHYKCDNIDLRRRIQDLEDETRALKEKLRGYISKRSGRDLQDE